MIYLLIIYLLCIVPAYRINRKSILDNYSKNYMDACEIDRVDMDHVRKMYYDWGDVRECLFVALIPITSIYLIVGYLIKKLNISDTPPKFL